MSQDILKWEKFYQHSNLNYIKIPNKISKYNRLLLHTNNFFLIAGYGSFNEGYILLLPKKLISSFAQLDNKLIKEFNWLRFKTKKILKKIYNDSEIAMFEHGMCACLGGLDRAHLHFMPYKKINSKNIIYSINKTLKKRNIGNIEIKFADHILKNPADIDYFFKNKSTNKKLYKVSGRIFKLKDILSNIKPDNYPSNLVKNLNLKPYIYFNVDNLKSSFITFNDISTQFGREILFNIDYGKKINLIKFLKKNNIKYNENHNYWKWQEFNFDHKIRETIVKFAKHMIKEKSNNNKKLYNLKSFYFK